MRHSTFAKLEQIQKLFAGSGAFGRPKIPSTCDIVEMPHVTPHHCVSKHLSRYLSWRSASTTSFFDGKYDDGILDRLSISVHKVSIIPIRLHFVFSILSIVGCLVKDRRLVPCCVASNMQYNSKQQSLSHENERLGCA